MIEPVQEVEKPRLYEPQRRLAPSRIEPDQTRIAGELECAYNASGRQEPQNSDHAQSQLREPGTDRKVRRVRMNRVLEQHVEQRLVPIDFRVVRQPRARDVR